MPEGGLDPRGGGFRLAEGEKAGKGRVRRHMDASSMDVIRLGAEENGHAQGDDGEDGDS